MPQVEETTSLLFQKYWELERQLCKLLYLWFIIFFVFATWYLIGRQVDDLVPMFDSSSNVYYTCLSCWMKLESLMLASENCDEEIMANQSKEGTTDMNS